MNIWTLLGKTIGGWTYSIPGILLTFWFVELRSTQTNNSYAWCLFILVTIIVMCILGSVLSYVIDTAPKTSKK